MKRVLLIEDDKEVSFLLEDVLLEQGYEVITAYEGRTGCRLGMEGDYDAIVTDQRMPEMTGDQVIRHLRAAGVRTPILMVSAEFPEEEARACGANDYLRKSQFRMTEFAQRVDALLQAA